MNEYSRVYLSSQCVRCQTVTPLSPPNNEELFMLTVQLSREHLQDSSWVETWADQTPCHQPLYHSCWAVDNYWLFCFLDCR